MTPTGMREKFEYYRNWFMTLLVQEFINLPFTYQAAFIKQVEKFLENCRKVHEESKNIKEKTIELTVERLVPDNSNPGKIIGYCTIPEVENKVKIFVPDNTKIGSKINCTVFSIDEKTWYSSKKELITKEMAV